MSDAEGAATYHLLVVRLQSGEHDHCPLVVDIAGTSTILMLHPATFIVRLYQQPGSAIVRGTIQLHGGEQRIPLQSNLDEMMAFIRAWLLEPNSTAGA